MDTIGRLNEAMPLVGENDVLYWHSTPLQVGYHLIGFLHWHVGIISTMDVNVKRIVSRTL
jgi:hypothetical protein